MTRRLRDPRLFLGASFAILVTLGLFALAPLLLDQDVRTTPPLRETVDLRVPVRLASPPPAAAEPESAPPSPPAPMPALPEPTPALDDIPAPAPPPLAVAEAPLPSLKVSAPPKPPPPRQVTPKAPPPKQPPPAAAPVPTPAQPTGSEAAEARPAAAPQAAGGEGRGYAMDQVDTVPAVIGQPRPAYPYRARRRNIEGWVKIRFLVDQRGRVNDLTVLQSSPQGVFEAAVRDAVPRWRFRPGIRAGQAVDVWVETTIQFELD
jgi:protein TonB